jgi:hypothetical protein
MYFEVGIPLIIVGISQKIIDRLITEIIQYSNDGIKFMIEKGWIEQTPQNVDRETLKKET